MVVTTIAITLLVPTTVPVTLAIDCTAMDVPAMVNNFIVKINNWL